jgi:hypothetical protein
MKKNIISRLNISNKKLFVIIGCFILVIIIAATIAVSLSPESKIKQTIADEIERNDFKIDEIVIKDGDWVLAKISSTSRGDSNNPSFNILHSEENVYRLVLGPGTDFDIDSLIDNEVPESIIRYFFGDEPLFVHFGGDSPLSSYSTSLVQAAKAAITLYSRAENIDLKRAALDSDSWQSDIGSNRPHTMSTSLTFDVLVNNETELLTNIIIDDFNATIQLRKNNAVAFEATIDLSDNFITVGSDPMPDNTHESTMTGVITLTKDYLNYINNNDLPPLEINDRANLYYSFPIDLPNQTSLYKTSRYDFYY